MPKDAGTTMCFPPRFISLACRAYPITRLGFPFQSTRELLLHFRFGTFDIVENGVPHGDISGLGRADGRSPSC